MSFYDLIQDLIADTLGSSGCFPARAGPRGDDRALLLLRMIGRTRPIDAFYVMFCRLGRWRWPSRPPGTACRGRCRRRAAIFTGMLVFDDLFGLHAGRCCCSSCCCWPSSRGSRASPIATTPTDFYVLVLGATLGMCLMVSANHMLIVFLGVEMASVPSYVLAGMLKSRRTSSEAALKYAVFGAGTAGVMLYGISLLAGVLGSVHLPTMAVQLAERPAAATPARSSRGAGARRADGDGRAGVQAVGRAVPFLVPRRLRRGHGRGRRVFVGRLEGGRPGLAGAAGAGTRVRRSVAHPRTRQAPVRRSVAMLP